MLSIKYKFLGFYNGWPDRIKMFLVWRLPKWIVYWCVIRVGGYASTGQYSNQIVPDLTLIDALKRWEKK